jgi:hypothetical protein
MDKKIAGLLGAVAAVSTLGSAQAAPTPNPMETLRANSFAELLEPISNAAELLQAVDEQPAPSAEGKIQLAQFYHHHHHHAYRRFAPRIIVVPRHRHHHHHHHHSSYRRGY